MRKFETGATRDDDQTKPDYEGFLSPLVVERFGQYMSQHRKQADGNLRDSDNWQKGIPLDAYMKSGWRHFVDWWKAHRKLPGIDLEDTLCAVLFNVQGYLHETLKAKAGERVVPVNSGEVVSKKRRVSCLYCGLWYAADEKHTCITAQVPDATGTP